LCKCGPGGQCCKIKILILIMPSPSFNYLHSWFHSASNVKKPSVCEVLSVTKETIVLFEKTSMELRSQRPRHVQGDAGHPG
jgi:hypothetical protein